MSIYNIYSWRATHCPLAVVDCADPQCFASEPCRRPRVWVGCNEDALPHHLVLALVGYGFALHPNPHERAPGTGATKWGGGHLDVQITRSGWDATPRREMLAIWLWCNGVPENRGAM